MSFLLDAARARWARIRVEHPETRPALPLHERLLSAQIALADALPAGSCQAPPEVVEAALDGLAGGTAAFRSVAPPPALDRSITQVTSFSTILAAGGAGPAAVKVGTAVSTGAVDPHALVRASWLRDPDRAAELAGRAGLNLQVAWLAAELATAPLAHCWQDALLGATEAGREALVRWDRGDCPACGAWPVMAEYFLGDRLNRCAYCAAAWPLSSARCTYCGERGADFRTIVANRTHPGRRLELCRRCGGYLKTIDVARPTPFPLLAIEDLASQDLDRAAQHHGFRRTPLAKPGR